MYIDTTKTTKALDIAKYIISYCNKKEYEISNLKLQKILYFTQGVFLAETDKVCFEDEITFCSFGVIVSDVYEHFAKYGNMSIPNIDKKLVWSNNSWQVKNICYDNMEFLLDIDSQQRINRVVDFLNDFTNNQLSKIILKQSPCKNRNNKIISTNELKSFFIK